MTDETGLLQACLRVESGAEKIRGLHAFGPKDWDRVIPAAFRFGVGPMLYYVLKPIASDLDIPGPAWERIQRAYYASLGRNLRLYRELSRLLALFREHSLPVILLKGAHLAEFVYPDPALRPMNDVDLLVRQNDLDRVHAVLIRDGYACQDENPGKCLEHVAPYVKPRALKIDVHFNITRPPLSERFDVAELWERALLSASPEVEALTLSPEDLLLHICAHTCVHHVFDNGLIPFVDVHQTLTRCEDALDWRQLWQRAEDWGLERPLCVMLMMTEWLLGWSAPERARRMIQSEPESQQAMDTVMHLIHAEETNGVSPFVARLFNRGGRRIAPRLLLRLLFPAHGIMFRTPAGHGDKNGIAAYAIYLKRLQVLARVHGKTLWLRLRRDPDTVRAIMFENRKNNLRDWMVGER